MVTMRSSTWSPLTTKTRLVPPVVCTAAAGTSTAGVCAGCSIRAVAKRPGFSSLSGLGTTASTRQRALVGLERGRDEADRAGELAAGIGVDLEGDRRADRDRRHELLGHGQLHAQRVDAHDDGDLHALGDVVADRDEPLGDQAGNGARTTVSASALCASATRARAACSA